MDGIEILSVKGIEPAYLIKEEWEKRIIKIDTGKAITHVEELVIEGGLDLSVDYEVDDKHIIATIGGGTAYNKYRCRWFVYHGYAQSRRVINLQVEVIK